MATKTPLRTEDICTIIKLCSESRVASLKWGDLCVEFGPAKTTPWAFPMESAHTEAVSPAPSPEKADTQEQETLLSDELRVKDDQLALMVIEDPAQYEELISSGELDEEDEREHGTEEA